MTTVGAYLAALKEPSPASVSAPENIVTLSTQPGSCTYLFFMFKEKKLLSCIFSERCLQCLKGSSNSHYADVQMHTLIHKQCMLKSYVLMYVRRYVAMSIRTYAQFCAQVHSV